MSATGFSDDQRRALNGVLDEMIPPSADGRLPGAGEIDLAAAAEKAAAQNPGMRPVIEQGLATLAEVARERGHADLAAAPSDERAEIMRALESRDAGFLMTLMFVAYASYYQHRRVLEGLGLESRAPHPKGYEMKPHNLELLEAVKRRGKMFRRC